MAGETVDVLGLKELDTQYLLLQKKALSSWPRVWMKQGNQYTKVTVIDLSGNQLSILSDSFFSIFPNTEYLCLQGNRLIELSLNVGVCQQLVTLKLDYNSLNSLPDSIGTLSHLQHLSVSNNRLVSVPKSIGNLANCLTILNIADNPITLLPSELGSLSRLRELYMYRTMLESIPVTVWRLEQLVSMSMEWFKYALPPLPTHMKGQLFRKCWEKVRVLCEQLEKCHMSVCLFWSFVLSLSDYPNSLNTPVPNNKLIPHKYIGRTLLQIAIKEADIGVVSILISLKPNINYLDPDGDSALSLAIQSRNPFILEKVLSTHPHINTGACSVGGILHLALLMKDVDVFNKLLELGANPDARDSAGNTPLHVALREYDELGDKGWVICKALLAAGANPNLLNYADYAAIHSATASNQLEAIRWILYYNSTCSSMGKIGFDIDMQGGEERLTALHIASKKHYYKIVQQLLAANAQTLIRNVHNQTARTWVGCHALVTKLLRRAERRQISTIIQGKYTSLKSIHMKYSEDSHAHTVALASNGYNERGHHAVRSGRSHSPKKSRGQMRSREKTREKDHEKGHSQRKEYVQSKEYKRNADRKLARRRVKRYVVRLSESAPILLRETAAIILSRELPLFQRYAAGELICRDITLQKTGLISIINQLHRVTHTGLSMDIIHWISVLCDQNALPFVIQASVNSMLPTLFLSFV